MFLFSVQLANEAAVEEHIDQDQPTDESESENSQVSDASSVEEDIESVSPSENDVS